MTHLWEWYLLSFSVWFKVGSLSWSFKYKNTKYKNTKKTSESDLTLVQLSSHRLASLIIHKAKAKVVPSIKGVRFLFVLHSFLYSPSFFFILEFFRAVQLSVLFRCWISNIRGSPSMVSWATPIVWFSFERRQVFLKTEQHFLKDGEILFLL